MIPTPIVFLPEWKKKCSEKLSKRGAKTELAKKLQELYTDGEHVKPLYYWTNRVNLFLNTDTNPAGEFVLAISHILDIK